MDNSSVSHWSHARRGDFTFAPMSSSSRPCFAIYSFTSLTTRSKVDTISLFFPYPSGSRAFVQGPNWIPSLEKNIKMSAKSPLG